MAYDFHHNRDERVYDADRPEPIIWLLDPARDALARLSYPLIRIATGLVLVPHGAMKLFGGGLAGTAEFMASQGLQPAYGLAVYIALLEFAGGLMMAAGLLTRLVAAQVVGFMAVAAFQVHWGNGFLWTRGGYEYPLYLGLVALAILFAGSGRWSLDRLIGREI